MTDTLGRALGLSPTEMEALDAAVPDGVSLAEWARHLLLGAAGQPTDEDELERPSTTVPAAAAPPGASDQMEVARQLGELTTKLRALGEVLAEIRDAQLAWHKAIFAEIAAHTAFPDEQARRVGLAKAAHELSVMEDRIRTSVARSRGERQMRIEAAASGAGKST